MKLSHILLLLSLSAMTLSDAANTPDELSKMQWRFYAKGTRAEMVREYAGKPYPVRVNFPGTPIGRTTFFTSLNPDFDGYKLVKNISNGKTPKEFPAAAKPSRGEIHISKLELHNPLQEWIPPYIGWDAEKINFSILPVNCIGKPVVVFEYDVGNSPGRNRLIQRKNIALDKLPAGKWTDFTVTLDKSVPRRLLTVRFIMNCKGGEKCEFYFSNINVIRKDGSTYAIFNTQEPSYLTGMKKPLHSGKFRELPKRPKIYIGYGSSWVLDSNYGYYEEMSKFFKEYLPGYDIVLSFSRTPEPSVVAATKNLPDNIYLQFQKAQHAIYYPAMWDALPKNAEGKQQNHGFNSSIGTHPLLNRAFKDQMDYSASLGFNNFKVYDYVWLYLGGRWGYDKGTVAAFRKDLQGKDAGLDMLSEADGKVKNVKFWDYFKELHGLTFSPAELGLKNFADFVPPKEKELPNSSLEYKRQYSVFLALCCYEWLKLGQDFNTWAKAHNGIFEYILNGEVWPNANDHVGLMRLKDSGMISAEFFIAYPPNRRSTYHAYGRFVRTAQRLNKDIFYTLETSTGGGARHPYWDLRTGYIVSYEMAAQGMTAFHYDHLGPWKDRNSNLHNKNSFNLFMSEARAFRQNSLDKTRRVNTNVLAVNQRSAGVIIPPATSGNTWDYKQWDPWNRFLQKNHVDYTFTDPQEMPLMLDNAKVVFYNSPVTMPETAAALEKWLDKGGKTLIMHSYQPFSKDTGRADFETVIKEVLAKPGKALFRGFKGQQPQGKSILNDKKGAPLLTVIPCGKESFIYYLHRQPRTLSPAVMDKVMALFINKLTLPRLQYPLANGNSEVTRYESKNFSVVSVWNKNITDTRPGKIREWHKTKHRLGYFDTDSYLFRHDNPGSECKALIPIAEAGTYRIYRYFEQKEETVTVGKELKMLLTVKDANSELFYIGKDTPAFRKHLEQVKANRKITDRFFQEQTQKWNVPGAPKIYAPDNWKIIKFGKDPVVKNNEFSCVSTGPDLILVPQTQQTFPAKDYNMLAFELLYDGKQKTHFEIFWERRGGKAGEKRQHSIPILPNSGKKMYLMDLSTHPAWTDLITRFRVDPVGRPGRITLGNVRFIDPKNELPVPAHAWMKHAHAVVDRKPSGGLLSGRIPAGQKDPFMHAALPVPIDADKLKKIEFELKLSPGCANGGQLFFIPEGQKGVSEKTSIRYPVKADGKFHKVVLNLKNNPLWKGRISQLRLDMTHTPPAEGATFELRNFSAKK